MTTFNEILVSGPARRACFALIKGVDRRARTRQESGNAIRLLRSIRKSSVDVPKSLSCAIYSCNFATLIMVDSFVGRLNRLPQKTSQSAKSLRHAFVTFRHFSIEKYYSVSLTVLVAANDGHYQRVAKRFYAAWHLLPEMEHAAEYFWRAWREYEDALNSEEKNEQTDSDTGFIVHRAHRAQAGAGRSI